MTTHEIRIDRAHWVETVARSLRGDCAYLTNPLHLEMTASAALGSWGDSDGLAATRDPFFLDVIGALDDAGDPNALAFLRGLEAVATPVIAEPSGAAAERCQARGAEPPECVAGIGTATPSTAWVARNPEGGEQLCVFADFAYPAAYDHTIAVFVDDDARVKYIAVTRATGEAPLPDMDVEQTDLAVAGAILMDAFDATDPLVERDNGEIEKLKLGALAYARAQSLLVRRTA
jgi:hypothetical protein